MGRKCGDCFFLLVALAYLEMDSVVLSKLTKRFDTVVAVDNADLTVHGGELPVVLGESGSRAIQPTIMSRTFSAPLNSGLKALS